MKGRNIGMLIIASLASAFAGVAHAQKMTQKVDMYIFDDLKLAEQQGMYAQGCDVLRIDQEGGRGQIYLYCPPPKTITREPRGYPEGLEPTGDWDFYAVFNSTQVWDRYGCKLERRWTSLGTQFIKLLCP